MPKGETHSIGPDTKIKLPLSWLVTIIATIVGAAVSYHNLNQSIRRELQDIRELQTNTLIAVRRNWSIEDQQNWTDELRRIQPGPPWPVPNDIIRRRIELSSARRSAE
jgi:hypothetical protein